MAPLIVVDMSGRKNKTVRSNSIIAYTETIPNRSISEVVQSENEESVALTSLKELIASEFAKVTRDLKAVHSNIKWFESHLDSIEKRLDVIEKGYLQIKKRYSCTPRDCR